MKLASENIVALLDLLSVHARFGVSTVALFFFALTYLIFLLQLSILGGKL